MAGNGKRRIEYLSLDEVQAASVNPKKHDAAGMDASISRFGFTEPIVMDERTGRMVAGHGRVEALRRKREAGDEPPDGVVVTKGVWMLPVVRGWASENDAQADAYLIASNRLVEAGGWDDRLLSDLLGTLEDDLLLLTGFDSDDLDDLQHRLLGSVGTETEGKTPAERAEAFAAAGIKSIILPYPAEECDEVARKMAKLRASRGLDTNAELVAALVNEETAREDG